MVEIKAKLKIRKSAYRIEVRDQLNLCFDERTKSRLRTHLVSGEEAALMLPRGEVLRGGDLVTASDGRIIEVVARPEKVLDLKCRSQIVLAKVAYQLGNRHVPVEVGEGYLRIAADDVLEDMVRNLGASVSALEAPFEPQAGAYGEDHRHDEIRHGGKSHECGQDDDHDREHCDHDHDHGHHGHHHHK
jgi:urease accessory protein